jgi:hypothetical protein
MVNKNDSVLVRRVKAYQFSAKDTFLDNEGSCVYVS